MTDSYIDGLLLFNKGGVYYRSAANLFFDSACRGNPKGMYMSAECFSWGWGVEPSIPDAQDYYENAALYGDGRANKRLIENGWEEDVTYRPHPPAVEESEESESIYQKAVSELTKGRENYQSAIRLLKKAYTAGNYFAAIPLGQCYLYALGVARNYEQAFSFFRVVEQLGYMPGKYYAALCRYNGWGVKAHPEQAVAHFQDIVKNYKPDIEKKDGNLDRQEEWHIAYLRAKLSLARYHQSEQFEDSLANVFRLAYEVYSDHHIPEHLDERFLCESARTIRDSLNLLSSMEPSDIRIFNCKDWVYLRFPSHEVILEGGDPLAQDFNQYAQTLSSPASCQQTPMRPLSPRDFIIEDGSVAFVPQSGEPPIILQLVTVGPGG